MNISLVSKWWWKLENEQGIWQDRAHANYIKDLCIGQIKHRHDDSPIWTDLLKIRHIYMNRKKFQVYNGKGPIWLDAWHGKVPPVISTLFYLSFVMKKISVQVQTCKWQPKLQKVVPTSLREQWNKVQYDALQNIAGI